MLQLGPDQAIAKGGEKIVFHHPEKDGLLVKVINPRYVAYMNKTWPLSTRFRRLPHYWFYINELVEHVFSREAGIEDYHYIQNIVGLVDTNLGLGMIVETITQENGELAVSLSDLITSNAFTEEHLHAINALIAWINANYIIIRDLTTSNIVWDGKNRHFVIIDGIGARHLPSLRSFSRRYNERGNRKRTDKLKKRIQGQFDKQGIPFTI